MLHFAPVDEFSQSEIHPAAPRRDLTAARSAVMRGGARDRTPTAPTVDVLALLAEVGHLREEMEHLREENECLRNAALTFGALAERLTLRSKSTTSEQGQ